MAIYSEQGTKQLTKQSSELLSRLSSIKERDLLNLRNVLRFHEYRYYGLADPLITDFEYDQLYKALEQLETEHPGLITPDSPTQRVATSLTKDFPTVQHLVPVLSLDNSYNAEDLVDFDRKAKELTGLPTIEYCIEPKFDGASISLIYENDQLVRGATRGDGVEGEDVTTNLKQVRSIPLSAPFSKYDIQSIEILGEVIMTKASFKKYNDALAEQGLGALANPRNAASGSLRIKDPKLVAKRNLEAFLYHISFYITSTGQQFSVDGETGDRPAHLKKDLLSTHSGSLELLWECGFRSPHRERMVLNG